MISSKIFMIPAVLLVFTVGCCSTSQHVNEPDERLPTKANTPDAGSAVPEASQPVVNDQDHRVRKMIDGLGTLISELEESKTRPSEIMDRVAALEKAVGPPKLIVPPVETACTSDEDCAYTNYGLENVQIGAPCCSSPCSVTAGSVSWVTAFEKTCRSYEPFRGDRPSQLPRCPGAFSCVTSNFTKNPRCQNGHCVPCSRTTDGTDVISCLDTKTKVWTVVP